MPRFLRVGARLLRSRHRRGSTLYLKYKRIIDKKAIRRANRRELQQDLVKWIKLGDPRSALAAEAASRGESWEQQAKSQKHPIDTKGLNLHRKCIEYIAANGLKRGESPWLRASWKALEPPSPEDWSAYVAAAGVPKGIALRAIVSESLSFPLTAAYAARLAGVTADEDTGALSLLILGAETVELSGLAKWAELLGNDLGLGDVRALHLMFVGPEVPKGLDGTMRRFRTQPPDSDLPPEPDEEVDPLEYNRQMLDLDEDGVFCTFARGTWHGGAAHRIMEILESQDTFLPPPPQLACAFNSGLAEHAYSWLPTLNELYWEGDVPLCCTSYHQGEAELDARTLAVRMRVPAKRMHCMPNPFASTLPHLDELFPGRVYSANAFLTVAVPAS